MIDTNLSSEEYKKLLAKTLKDKYDLLILGLAVIGAVVFIAYQLATSPAIEHVVASVKMPSIKVSDSSQDKQYNINFENLKKVEVQVPENIKPTETSAMILVTGIPKEKGEISAIKSNRRQKQKFDNYEVKIGDSLASIAQEVYGDYNLWTIIAKANNLTSPDQIEIGMKLKIPR